MAERFRHLLDETAFVRLQAALETLPPPAIRVNTLKISADAPARLWAKHYGWHVAHVPFCEAGWTVESEQPVSHTAEYKMGYYYIQDAASMLPAELFTWGQPDDDDAPLVLDMAAAPGGKTTHLAARMHDRGVLVANDSSKARVPALAGNLRSWGATCAAVTTTYGERFGQMYPETFDKVLLDAPCSMDNLREAGRDARRALSEREQRDLVKRQVRMLESALQAARVGGEIVYATCTLSPDENEGVIDTVLRSYRGRVEVRTVSGYENARGLPADGQHSFLPEVQAAVRLWPHLYGTGGFFAAALVKTAALTATKPQGRRDFVTLPPLSRSEYRMLEEMLQTYGFDLTRHFGDYHFFTLKGRIIAIPPRYLEVFPDLRAQVGFAIAEQTDLTEGAWLPAHDLLTRFDGEFAERRCRLEDSAAWLRGEDIPNFTPFQGGVLMENAQGLLVGRGWVRKTRIKNLLPSRSTL